MQCREIHRCGVIAEILGSGDTGCDLEQYSHGIIKGEAQPQQLTHRHLTYSNGVGET